ncbi:hypothetical protein GMSM_45830 [Geomonas sp. Red276]
MTVEETKVVDVIGIDKASGQVVLTIADHLEWVDEDSHLLALQEKLNSYLAFVEEGELLEQYPNSKDRRVRLDIVLKHSPSPRGDLFLRKAQDVVAAAGFSLEYRVLEDVH